MHNFVTLRGLNSLSKEENKANEDKKPNAF